MLQLYQICFVLIKINSVLSVYRLLLSENNNSKTQRTYYRYLNQTPSITGQFHSRFKDEISCFNKCDFEVDQCVGIEFLKNEGEFDCWFFTERKSLSYLQSYWYLSKTQLDTSGYCEKFEHLNLCVKCDCIDSKSTHLPYYCDCRKYQTDINHDCNETISGGDFYKSGLYTINPSENGNVDVFCEIVNKTAYTIFMNRYIGSVFPTLISDYINGFWLGLTTLHRISKNNDYTLRIEFLDYYTHLKDIIEYKGFGLNEFNQVFYYGTEIITGNPIDLLFNKINSEFIRCSLTRGFWWHNCIVNTDYSHFPTGKNSMYMGPNYLSQVKMSMRNEITLPPHHCKDISNNIATLDGVYTTNPNVSTGSSYRGRCYFRSNRVEHYILDRRDGIKINSSRESLINGYYIDDSNYFIGFENFYRILQTEGIGHLYIHLYGFDVRDHLQLTIPLLKITNTNNFTLDVSTTTPYFKESSAGIQECDAHGGGWWWFCDANSDFIPTLKDKIVYNDIFWDHAILMVMYTPL